jgi:hypothetical protein
LQPFSPAHSERLTSPSLKTTEEKKGSKLIFENRFSTKNVMMKSDFMRSIIVNVRLLLFGEKLNEPCRGKNHRKSISH